jgi:tetratricopeptide (TPR) repeat protein
VNQEEIVQKLQIAVSLHNSGDFERAEAIYRDVLSLDPNNFYALNFCGCIRREKKEYEQGVELFVLAIAQQPGNPDVHYNLGNLYKDASRWNDAIECYERAIQIRNDYPEALNNLGTCLKEVDRCLDSITILKRAIALQPGFVGAWLNLGNTLKEEGEVEEAIASYRKAIEIKPDFADAYLNLGNTLKEEGEVEEAIASYRKAIEIKPDFADAYLNLGNTLKEEGEVEEAIASYRKAIEIKPDFADAYLNLGNTLKEEGEVEEAIASYRKAIEIKPDFADAYLNLGNTLKEEGEVEAAADAFAEHYRLKPIAQSLSFVSTVAPQSLNTAYELKVPESAEFIPSYVSHAIPFGMHLMYVHIPKAGGIRFANPIFGCIQETLLEGGWQKYSDLVASAFGRNEVSVMASHRIDSDPMRDGIVAAFSSYDLPALDFSFLTPHGVSSRELFQGMRDQFDVQPKRLATWRDPRKRMRSALDYLWRTSEGDLDLVEKKIRERDPFLDNAIYRGCFSDFSPQMLPDEQRDVQVDHLIDIGDFSVMNQIMSSFLSRCRLPNIIVNKRVNVTSTDKKMDAGLADSLMAQCVEAGFITLDGAPVIEQMVSSGLPAEFDLHVDPSSASLHPLTFVLNAVTDIKTVGDSWLLPTEALMADQGQEFLKKTFAQ